MPPYMHTFIKLDETNMVFNIGLFHSRQQTCVLPGKKQIYKFWVCVVGEALPCRLVGCLFNVWGKLRTGKKRNLLPFNTAMPRTSFSYSGENKLFSVYFVAPVSEVFIRVRSFINFQHIHFWLMEGTDE